MADFVKLTESDDCISVVFDIEDGQVTALGERIAEICGDVCMNGYNWDALLRFYLRKNMRALLNGMETDPEAGLYAAYYGTDDESRARAQALADLIAGLVTDGDALCGFAEQYGSGIEWD
ncbi:MAG: hypothetical protein J5722_01255 [Oscillospiraceae bacterium]|nr:hypothetical protein [Oscillospiraceae bacterium]